MGDQGHSFAFINKNASNLSSKEHIKKATSHAQSVTWNLRQKGLIQLTKRTAHKNRPPKSNSQSSLQGKEDVDSEKYPLSVRRHTDPNPNPASPFSDPSSDLILAEQLDPFMSLPSKTTRHERNLLHFYFSAMPTSLYGTNLTSSYCPVRDRTSIFVQVNSAWLECVILSAELAALGPTAAETSMTVLARKALLYRSIREELQTPATSHSDTTIARITLAAVAENRVGHLPSEAQKHLAAVKRLIIDRGDRWSRMPITTIVAFIFLGTGVAAFPYVNMLEAAIASFTGALLAFQRRQPDQFHESLQFHYSVYTFQGRPGVLLNTYIRSRHRAFSQNSPLRPFVEGVLGDRSTAESRSHMAILWVLNRILWDLRFDHDKSITFLDRLYNIVGSMGPEGNLKAITVLFIIMDCVARMGVPTVEQIHNITDIITSRGDDDRRISWWWEAVDAVEMMLLLKEATREKILGVLSAELIGVEAASMDLTGSLLDDVPDEIRLGWLYRA